MIWFKQYWSQTNYYSYPQISEYKWAPKRKGGEKVKRRPYGVTPKDQNEFYLRMLFLLVRGAISFADLSSYNRITHNIFKVAVVARVILQDNGERYRCLKKILNSHMPPRQLRELLLFLWTNISAWVVDDH